MRIWGAIVISCVVLMGCKSGSDGETDSGAECEEFDQISCVPSDPDPNCLYYEQTCQGGRWSRCVCASWINPPDGWVVPDTTDDAPSDLEDATDIPPDPESDGEDVEDGG